MVHSSPTPGTSPTPQDDAPDGARRTFVVADAAKHDAELLVSFAALGQVDVLVSDVAPEGALADALDEADAEVWVA